MKIRPLTSSAAAVGEGVSLIAVMDHLLISGGGLGTAPHTGGATFGMALPCVARRHRYNRHVTGSSGRYAQKRPVATDARRCRASAGCTSAIARIAVSMRIATAFQIGRAHV